jgi:hypothetical protein
MLGYNLQRERERESASPLDQRESLDFCADND